jgi:hypothetical protein
LGGLWVEFSANVAGQKWHANLPKPKIINDENTANNRTPKFSRDKKL